MDPLPQLCCPQCRLSLAADFYCAQCRVRFPSRQLGNTQIVDFLFTTHPAGECRCPEEQIEERCHVVLDGLKPASGGPRARHYKARILEPFLSYSNKFILDVGCREAPVGHLLAGRNAVVGVDMCPRGMLAGTPNALDKGYRALLIADAGRLPLADQHVDLVIATDILEHVLTPEKLLAEFRRVLKPGGELLVTCPNLVSYNNRVSILCGSGVGLELHLLLKGRSPVNPISGARYPDQKMHLRFFTLGSLRRTVGRCGFEVLRAWGCDPVLSRIPGGDRVLARLCLLAVVWARKRPSDFGF